MIAISACAFFGCASQNAPSAPPRHAARPANRYIYVTPRDLPGECYTDLGPVKFTENYADAAVDPDQSEAAGHLRAAAMKSYPDDVDAVIGVKSEQNDVGTIVTVSGEAVRLEDRSTVRCALRGSEGVMDKAAMIGAGAIAGATVGGLVGGAGGATSAGLAGGSAMAAHEAMEHQASVEQQQEDLRKTLAAQRREITMLLKERAQLRNCQQQEITLKNCPASPPPDSGSSGNASAKESADQNAIDATPFQIEKHLQEQQDFIKRLKNEIAQLKWQMGGGP